MGKKGHAFETLILMEEGEGEGKPKHRWMEHGHDGGVLHQWGKEGKRLESLLGFYFRRLLLSGVPWTCVAKPYCFL